MRLFKLWFPVLIWCWIIFYLSSVPNLQTPWEFWDFVFRKIAHITEYFILTLLAYRAFKGTFDLKQSRLFSCSGLFSLLYAASDEIHQYFVPTRGPSLGDVLIDGLGIISFLIGYKYLKNITAAIKSYAKNKNLLSPH